MSWQDAGTIALLFLFAFVATILIALAVGQFARLFEPLGRRLREWLWPDDEQEFEEKP